MFSFFKKRSKKSAQEFADITPVTTERPAFTDYDLTGAIRSDVGCCREVNEDRAFLRLSESNRHSSLLVVADGMGGHAAGEIASNLAVEAIGSIYEAHQTSPKIDVSRELEKAFQQANRSIQQVAKKDRRRRGMGTTCTALIVRDGFAYYAHVGDSRLYLIREGRIYQMSEDHSAVMELVRRGVISLAEARHREDKNIILRALGTQPKVEISGWKKPFPVRAGDAFVLCSDGLYDLVEDEEIGQVVMQTNPETACEHLISLALQRGGHDNVTIGVLEVRAKNPMAVQAIQPTRELQIVY